MEAGPAPLSPLDADAPLAFAHRQPLPAWSPLTSSSSVSTKDQVAGVRSNLWPGAVCAAQGRHFASIYVGWGLKSPQFAPAPPPAPAPHWPEALLERTDLPPKPAPPEEEDE